MRQWTLVIAAAILMGGCAAPKGNDQATPSTPSPTSKGGQPVEFSTVTVSRTGGIAGFNDKYTVTPDGALTVQTRRTPPVTKKLTPDELSQLRTLVTSDTLLAEAKSGPLGAKNCADGFIYTVSTGTVSLGGMDCGQLAEKAPTMWKVVQLVQEASHRT